MTQSVTCSLFRYRAGGYFSNYFFFVSRGGGGGQLRIYDIVSKNEKDNDRAPTTKSNKEIKVTNLAFSEMLNIIPVYTNHV